MIGKNIAHYEITELLGRGGMGEVYRARDSKLGRDIALKVLPLDFAADPERVARFRREAKLLAALNHPNIAAIYGLEESEGKSFLVMELAEGEDLDTKIARGAMSTEEALEIARQIAEALEEAHENGIVHRDLKPANVRVSAEGKVKVLDFGLARAFVGEAVDEEDVLNSPTITAAMTQKGMILGTAAYMSPEQARGRTVDRRADLWSFGVLLWEMLSGKRLFEGETVSDTLAAVLRAEPPWESLPEDLPPAVRRLLERCLERDPRKRLRDIGEARIRLERWKSDPSSLLDSSASLMIAADEPSRRRRALPWVIAAVMAAAAAFAWLAGPDAPAPSGQTMQLELQLQHQANLHVDGATNVVLSPNGEEFIYLSNGMIHLRRLDNRVTRSLAGTEGAAIACYSPDSQWIAFTAQGKLKRVSVTGGSPVTICDCPDSRGVAWVNESTIVFSPHFSQGLMKVSLSDGIPRALTTLDSTKAERSHRWPHALAGGDRVLFNVQYFGRDYDEGDIQIASVVDGTRQTCYRGGANPRYAASGHLLFVRENTVFAIPMDLQSAQTSGLATPVIDNVWASTGDQESADGSAQYDLSRDGILIFRTATELDHRTQLGWFDLETGAVQPLGPPQRQTQMVPDPSWRRVAILRGEDADAEVFVVDLVNGVESRLTFADGADVPGCWSPDGRDVFYSRPSGDGTYIAYRKPADGSGAEQEITRHPATLNCDDVSPDGRWLSCTIWGGGSNVWDLRLLDLENPGEEPTILADGPGMQYEAVFSPDGHWLAHLQNQSGVWEVYVRRFPDTGARWQLTQSNSQFQHLNWNEDGSALYTRDNRGFLRIDLEFRGGGVLAAPPRVIQPDSFVRSSQWVTSATTPDGSRALVLLPYDERSEAAAAERSSVVFVTDWLEELARKVPVSR